jgi:hypothetical protein
MSTVVLRRLAKPGRALVMGKGGNDPIHSAEVGPTGQFEARHDFLRCDDPKVGTHQRNRWNPNSATDLDRNEA